jgi:YNFM family putative membrane transporter
VLPVLQIEFNTDTVMVSYTVAAVILGVAIATLPFGILVDHMPIKPIILGGGTAIAVAVHWYQGW